MKQKMSKKKKWILFSSAAVVLIAIIAASLLWNKKVVTEVQTGKVEKKEMLESKVSATGEIRAKEFIDIQAEITGIVTELPVREGDSVKKGDLLLKLDPLQSTAEMESTKASYEAAMSDAGTQKVQIASAEANILRDEAQLRQLESELEQAKYNFTRSQKSFERIQQLNEENLVSRDEYEQSQNQMRIYKSQTEATQARMEQLKAQSKVTSLSIQQMKSAYQSAMNRAGASQANLKRSMDQLRKTIIYSPLTGIITKKNVEIGERAVPGIQSNPQATLLTIADMSIVQVELKVDETDIVNVTLGNLAKVKVDALPDQEIKGTVTEIGSSPINAGSTTASQEAKDFKVIVDLIDPPSVLKSGLSATAVIITKTKNNILTIPFQALTIRDVEVDDAGNYIPPKEKPAEKNAVSADSGKTTKKPKKKELQGIFIVDKTNKARFTPIETGITGETEIEVLKGLAENQEIVVGSYKTIRTLEEGTLVKINNTKKPDSAEEAKK
jgi:HlyD family secretion protein